ncbi:MAG: hypothetical protein WBJ48_00650 [Bacteroidales bacterium]|jgi:hypothetical protein|nr:hypothetical protein [Bacteroidales bacterium]MDI9573992.1 hypothetical protein [Bacteroidota bacterium]HQB24741.1 hypothetical protein [Bacteroidales bacterium]HQI63564.1 hypothetical protein [Bacteroidales bacterium]HQL06961.1 hypothetical protein [Bacteroidales bacterium]
MIPNPIDFAEIAGNRIHHQVCEAPRYLRCRLILLHATAKAADKASKWIIS